MKTADVAIVGAGLIGIAAALELRTQGLAVTVLDRQEPGREASSAAAGMLAPGPDDAASLPLVPLGKASIALYPEFVGRIEQLSGKTTGFAQKGTLELFFGANGEAERNRFIGERNRLGLAVEAISIAKARQMEPLLGPSAVAAAWLSEEAVANPRLLTSAAIAAAKAAAVDIQANCAVTGLICHANRCTGVITNGGPISAARVVIAAGCFSDTIGSSVARYAPTTPVRGQMVALQTATRLDGSPPLRHVLRSADGYLVPHGDGRILAGSTLERNIPDKIITSAGVRKILNTAFDLAPSLQGAEIAEMWAGLRPGTPDGLPILGPTDLEGLIIATGHYRNGILLAPVTARLVGQFVLGVAPAVGVKAFSPMRFANSPHSLQNEPPARGATV